MGDILKVEIGSKAKVLPCKECGVAPVVMQRKSKPGTNILCPNCRKQSQLYSWSGKLDWKGYDPVAMAVCDWNHKNRT